VTDTELPPVEPAPVLPPHQFAVEIQQWAMEAFYAQPSYPMRYAETEKPPA
jgi:hypothetical protein